MSIFNDISEFLAANNPIGMAMKRQTDEMRFENALLELKNIDNDYWNLPEPEFSLTTSDNAKASIKQNKINWDLRDYSGPREELLQAIDKFITEANKQGIPFSIQAPKELEEAIDILLSKPQENASIVASNRDATTELNSLFANRIAKREFALSEYFKQLNETITEQNRLLQKQADLEKLQTERRLAAADVLMGLNNQQARNAIAQIEAAELAEASRKQAMQETLAQFSPLYKQIVERLQLNTQKVIDIEKKWAEPVTFANVIPRLFAEFREIGELNQAKKAIEAYSKIIADLDAVAQRQFNLFKLAENRDRTAEKEGLQLAAQKENAKIAFDLTKEKTPEQLENERQLKLNAARQAQLNTNIARTQASIERLERQAAAAEERAIREEDAKIRREQLDAMRAAQREAAEERLAELRRREGQAIAYDKHIRENAKKWGIAAINELPEDIRITEDFLRKLGNKQLVALLNTGQLDPEFYKLPLEKKIDVYKSLGSSVINEAVSKIEKLWNNPRFAQESNEAYRIAGILSSQEGKMPKDVFASRFFEQFLLKERSNISNADNVFALKLDKIEINSESGPMAGIAKVVKELKEKKKDATLIDLAQELKANLGKIDRSAAAQFIYDLARQHVKGINEKHGWHLFDLPGLDGYKIYDGLMPKTVPGQPPKIDLDRVYDFTDPYSVMKFFTTKRWYQFFSEPEKPTLPTP